MSQTRGQGWDLEAVTWMVSYKQRMDEATQEECAEKEGARCPNLGNVKPRGTRQAQQRWSEKLGSWTEGRNKAQRAGRKFTQRGKHQPRLILQEALARKKEKPLDLATNFTADPCRVGSPPRLGRRPDCCGSSSKWEEK